MYGFKPKAQRQTTPSYADGGVVARMKSADAGAAPFGSRGLHQLREMPAKMEAMGFGPAKADAVSAPAPVSDSRAARLQAMIPQIEAMGFKQAQAAADGGVIRGPGDGTSDSIADEMEPGTFIMPADSTQALGLDNEGAEGEKVPVRVSNGEYELPPERVQAVGAAVLEAIKGMTHTPTGQGGDEAVEGEPRAQGFRPKGELPQFFAQGGMVESPTVAGVPPPAPAPAAPMGWAERNEQRNNQVTASSIVDSPERRAAEAALKAPDPSTGGALAGSAATPTPASPAAPMGWEERNAQRSNQVTASSMVDSPERRAAQASLNPVRPATQPTMGAAPATGAAAPALGFPPAAPGFPKPATSQPGLGFKPAQQFADGGKVRSPEEQARLQSPTTPDAPASANVARGAAFGVFNRQETAGNRGGMMEPIAATGPKTFEPAKSVYGSEMRMNATTDPRSLSFGGDDVSVAAPYRGAGANPDPSKATATPTLAATSAPAAQQPPATTVVPTPSADRGSISPPSTAPSAIETAPPRNGGQISAQNMAAADNLAPSVKTAPPLPTPAGFPGAPGYQGVTAPVVRNSTNDWQARNNLRNLEVSASSITNNGGRFDRSGKGDSAAQAAYKAALGTDQVLQQAQTGADVTAMRENAGLQREGIQQQGANARDAARVNLAGQELGMKREAQGFQTRAASRLEAMQNAYAAEKDPAKQAALARQIREIQGKEQPARYKVVAGGQQVDDKGMVYKVPDRIFNEQTGEVVQQGQGGARSSPVAISNDDNGKKAFAALPSGAEFVGPDGKTYRKS